MKLLDKMEEMVAECPPIQQPQRFGNKAFRNWYDKLKVVRLYNDRIIKTYSII